MYAGCVIHVQFIAQIFCVETYEMKYIIVNAIKSPNSYEFVCFFTFLIEFSLSLLCIEVNLSKLSAIRQ